MVKLEEMYGPGVLVRRLAGLGVFSLLVLLAPLGIRDQYLLELLFLCHYYVILACSWDLLTGFTGNVNFGHAFFIAGAGFTGAPAEYPPGLVLLVDHSHGRAGGRLLRAGGRLLYPQAQGALLSPRSPSASPPCSINGS